MTKIEPEFRAPGSLFWIVFFALTVFVYLFGLNIPLLGPDEPRYAQVAREMFERGDWITPTLGGYDWFEKPALLYWLQISFFNLFGVSEYSARLGSAFFGLGTILSLWKLGRCWEQTGGTEKSSEFAKWLAMAAATSFGLLVFARGASFDIILTFPMTAAMVGFFVFDRRESTGGTASTILPLSCFYLFSGLALLAKGLVGIVFPFAIVGIYYLVSRRFPSRRFLASLFWGLALTAAVAAIWYLPMYLANGWKFIDEFFIQHHFQRYTSNKYLHPQPFFFFFWVLPLMTLPWLPFFFAAVWRIAKNIIKGSLPGDPLNGSSPLVLFALTWMLVPLVFFSFSGSKLPGYIMPSLPPAIILATLWLHEFAGRKAGRERRIKAVATSTLVVAVGVIVFALPRFADLDSVKGLIDAANNGGFTTENVLTLHAVSHNAEFYAAGRLVRDEDGKQKKLLGPAEVLAEVRRSENGSALVLVPLEYLKQLESSQLLKSERIRDNGEFAIVHVTAAK